MMRFANPGPGPSLLAAGDKVGLLGLPENSLRDPKAEAAHLRERWAVNPPPPPACAPPSPQRVLSRHRQREIQNTDSSASLGTDVVSTTSTPSNSCRNPSLTGTRTTGPALVLVLGVSPRDLWRMGRKARTVSKHLGQVRREEENTPKGFSADRDHQTWGFLWKTTEVLYKGTDKDQRHGVDPTDPRSVPGCSRLWISQQESPFPQHPPSCRARPALPAACHGRQPHRHHHRERL